MELADALATQAARLIVAALERVDTLTPTPQDGALATHAPMLVKEDGFVRWADSAAQIVNRYRGVAAWPQTTAFLNGARLKLKALTAAEGHGQPGEVLRVDETGMTVAAGAGAVRIGAVQPEARKAQPAQAWAHAAGVAPGTRLDVWEPPVS
mgnify:CR=1 FL=1